MAGSTCDGKSDLFLHATQANLKALSYKMFVHWVRETTLYDAASKADNIYIYTCILYFIDKANEIHLDKYHTYFELANVHEYFTNEV